MRRSFGVTFDFSWLACLISQCVASRQKMEQIGPGEVTIGFGRGHCGLPSRYGSRAWRRDDL